MPISGPLCSGDYPDRFVTCEQAIENDLQALIARAVEAGWDEMEACSAIASLTDHHVLAMLSNADVDRQIASADPRGIVLRTSR